MKTLTIYENTKTGNLTCEKQWVNVIEHKFTTLKSVVLFIEQRCFMGYNRKKFITHFYRLSNTCLYNIDKEQAKKLFNKYTR